MKKRSLLKVMVFITVIISITISLSTLAHATGYLPEEATQIISEAQAKISGYLPERKMSQPEETTSEPVHIDLFPEHIFNQENLNKVISKASDMLYEATDFIFSLITKEPDQENVVVETTEPASMKTYEVKLLSDFNATEHTEEFTYPSEESTFATEETVSFTEETVQPTEATLETVQPTQETTAVDLEELDKEPLKIFEIDKLEDGTKIFRFKRGNYTVPYNPVNEEPMVSKNGYVEQIINVPHYFQQSYPNTRYGGYGTVSSHGCGITSCAMVYSYLLDKPIMPDELAETYGRFNTKVGSDYRLFETSASDLGLNVTRTYKWQDVETALQNGCVVIANVRENIFTSGGHYIVYYGITEEGRVLVNDPSIYNYGKWSNINLKEGFQNGFDQKFVKYSFPCWIYDAKDIEHVAEMTDYS